MCSIYEVQQFYRIDPGQAVSPGSYAMQLLEQSDSEVPRWNV